MPAQLYIDETDYADRMLEDVPAVEFAAAVLEPVDDAEIRGSNSGSNTDVTDETYSGGSASVSDGYNTDGICELEEQLGAVDLGDSSLSETEDFELALGLSASVDSELNKHPADCKLELDMVANEMSQMQISQSEISLRARELPEVDQSEISLRAREIPLIDQQMAAATDGETREPRFGDSDDQHGQDSPKKDFIEKNENSNFLETTINVPEEVTCEPASGMRDRIYWAFSDAPLLTLTEAHDPSRPAYWGTHNHFHEIQDSALAGGALVGERNERVRAYYCADFEPENREFAYASWDVHDQIGTSFGHTLIDSGASRHSLGRLGMACAMNVRSIEPPLIMETANGDVAITLEGDIELADGTIVRDWLLNKYSETNLISEGLCNADDPQSDVKFFSSGNSAPRTIHTLMTQTLARKVGVLDSMPPELDLVAQCDLGQRPLVSPLVQQYQDIVSNYSMKEKDIAQHEKAGHYPKMPGCSVCERAHAQARGARKGGSSKPRSRTANVDLIDWGSCDAMGMRYTATVVCAETHHPTVRCTRTKKGPIVSDAVLDAIHEIERLTDSTGEWSLDRLHSDQGSEFKSQLKLQLKRLRIEQTTGEPGHHTDSAIVENFNKMLEHCCTALALTGLETPAMSMQIHSELAMHATDLIRLRSLTPFQKEHGISCMQEQTGEVPDRSVLTKAACLSLAYGFVAKEKRSCKLAERAYMAILVGYDKQVKDAVRLVPFKRNADGTVTFYPTKVTKNYKVFDRVYPLAGAPVEYPPLDECREWMAGDELMEFLADAEVDAAIAAKAEAEGLYTVASITAHNRFGDEPDQIEYLCKFDGYDHTHDAYLELSKLDDCASLISDYWLSQETDTERYERVKSMALIGSGSGGVCAECAELEPVVCPGGNCPPCCEMSGYTCCMDQHAAHSTQHTARTHAVDTLWMRPTTPDLSVARSLLASTQPSVHTPTATVDQHSVPTAPFEQSDQSDKSVHWWTQHCLQADGAAGDAVAHTFRVQQSLSAGELSPEVLSDLGPLLFADRSPRGADGNASDESMPGLMDDGTGSDSGSSTSSSMPDIEDVEVAMPSKHAMVLSTVCGDNGATVVQQM